MCKCAAKIWKLPLECITVIADVTQVNHYSYPEFVNDLHFKQKIVLCDSHSVKSRMDCLSYFNWQKLTFDFLAEQDGTLLLYKNSEIIKQLKEPKSFVMSSLFKKSELLSHYFDNEMQFNQWCFDNFLIHKISKKYIQLYAYYDAFSRHPMRGELSLPPFLYAKQHPELELSASLAEIAHVEPMTIDIKKGQSIHFDKYLYQIHYFPGLQWIGESFAG
ncbi:TPA: hypothetical protein F8R64_09245 [Legionella pneumophila]|nr:hypothetical protein [Legionella pneumophila]